MEVRRSLGRPELQRRRVDLGHHRSVKELDQHARAAGIVEREQSADEAVIAVGGAMLHGVFTADETGKIAFVLQWVERAFETRSHP